MYFTKRLGRQLGWGFAVVLMISATVGIVSVLAMRNSYNKAHEIFDSDIPAVAAASTIERHVLEAMYAIRTWSYTQDAQQLAQGRTHLKTLLEDVLPKAVELAKLEHLPELEKVATEAMDGVRSYSDLVTRTEAAETDRTRNVAERIASATKFQRVAVSLKEGHFADLQQEEATPGNLETVKRRIARLSIITSIIEQCYDIRLAIFICEASQDFSALSDLDARYARIFDHIRNLLQDTRRQENKDRLSQMLEHLQAYQKASRNWLSVVDTMKQLSVQRQEAAQHIQEAAAAAAKSNLARAATAAGTAAAQLSDSTKILLAGLLVSVFLGAFIAWRLARSITRPVIETSQALARLASCDFRTGMTTQRVDELGDMARSVDQAVHTLRETLLAVQGRSQQVDTRAHTITEASVQVAHASEETSRQISVVVASTEEISASMTTIASGTQEMSTSIAQIANHASEATCIAQEADERATAAAAEMQTLQSASDRINGAINLISSIAEQTNLLALNATIEAARAGDAGRGFAVVAAEVKALAGQTAQATRQISGMVQDIQTHTTSSQATIATFVAVVKRISELQQSVASAVEEQSATTKEITANVQDAATGVRQITENMAGVQNASGISSTAAASARDAAAELQKVSAELSQSVAKFSLA